MKKKVISAMVIVAALTVGTGYAFISSTDANAGNPLESLKSTVESLKKDPNKDQVVATLNGFSITKGHLATAVSTLQSMHEMNHDGKTATEEDGFNLIKKEHAVEKTAKAVGIQVTDQEVQDMVKNSKETYEKAATATERDTFKNMIDAMGLTEEQYWNDFMIKQGKHHLLEMKLHQHFKESHNSLYNQQDQDDKEWNKYLEEITQKEVLSKVK